MQIRQAFQSEDGSFPLWKSTLASMISGAGGAVVGTPADVTMVRMQADGKRPPELRRNYKNAIEGLIRIAREEGFFTMWKGCGPNMGRAMFMAAGQLTSYDQAKSVLLDSGYFKDNLVLHIISSAFAGLVATTVSNPLDVVKTRVMNSEKGVYSGSLDCFFKTVKHEGVFALWKGFLPFYIRLGPHTVITFLVFEQFCKFAANFT
eukprot:TRINITY_DN1511_c0_g1_i3.p1 TRINITY_DN1511_c0_g1~~TRINITY_DN1511_c0_g1_i3.p1  ORF type:complete len:205 (-),score=23.86 TRINITY_DN1511_c0_g1_i3:24-638(-)